MPGASVITTTVGALRSGKISTWVRISVMVPNISANPTNMRIVRRLLSEK